MSKLKKTEIIKIGKYKYVIYKSKRDSLDLLPIDGMLNDSKDVNILPIINISKDAVKEFQRIDNYELLWLINQKNPLIKEIIQIFMDKESKKR